MTLLVFKESDGRADLRGMAGWGRGMGWADDLFCIGQTPGWRRRLRSKIARDPVIRSCMEQCYVRAEWHVARPRSAVPGSWNLSGW